MHPLAHTAKCVLRVLFIIVNNTYCVPTYLVWMWLVFWPLRLFHPPLYWYIEGVLFKWLLCMVSAWSYGAEYTVLEVGEDITSCYNERCLVVANHQSTSDVPFLMVAFQKKHDITPSLLWIMDRLFRYTNFGTVSWTHGDFFITQGKDVRDSQLKKLEDHLTSVYLERNRKWIVLFPEGGFLSKRLETSQRYAEKNGFPVLKHVTLPRVGAMHSIMNTLTEANLRPFETTLDSEKLEPLKWIVDITVGYPASGTLSLPIICSSWVPPCHVYLHYRRFPISEVPHETVEQVQDWMYARWAEKEELLEEYYRTGTFPAVPKSQVKDHMGESGEPCDGACCECNGPLVEQKLLLTQPHKVTFSYWWIGFLHVFFITSTLLHCWLLWRIWHIVWIL